MEKLLSRRSAVTLLSVIEMLERFSYFGMRSLLVMYVVDSQAFALDNQEAFDYYSIFALLIAVVPLPTGIITDFLLKQNRAVVIGGIVAAAGYLLLIFEDPLVFVIGLLAIIVGTSLVRPNLAVLLGRLFDKRERRRDVAFTGYYLMINLGAFLGAFLLGYFQEELGWPVVFGLAGGVTLLYLLIFYFVKEQLPIIEQNLEEVPVTKSYEQVLDAPDIVQQPSVGKSISFILLFTALVALFWGIYQMVSSAYTQFVVQNAPFEFFGVEIPQSITYSLPSFFSMPVMLILFLIWSTGKMGSSYTKFIYAMFLISVAAFLASFMSALSIAISPVPVVTSFMIILALAETLIAPIAQSYLTRLSDVRYSSTIFGAYLLLLYLGSKAVTLLLNVDSVNQWLLPVAGIAALTAVLLIIFRKRLLQLVNGID